MKPNPTLRDVTASTPDAFSAGAPERASGAAERDGASSGVLAVPLTDREVRGELLRLNLGLSEHELRHDPHKTLEVLTRCLEGERARGRCRKARLHAGDKGYVFGSWSYSELRHTALAKWKARYENWIKALEVLRHEREEAA